MAARRNARTPRPQRRFTLTDEVKARAALAKALADRRDAAGLTQREMARILGVGHATVSAVEAGRDPRASTLLAYLCAFPSMRQSDLFPNERAVPPETSAAAWRAQEAFFGFRADAVVSRLTIGKRGERQSVLEIGPVRLSNGGVLSAELLASLMRAVTLGSHVTVRAITVTPRVLAAGRLRLTEDGTTHEYRFSKKAPTHVTYVRTSTLRAASAAGTEGSAHEITHPVGKLVLEVTVPEPSRIENARVRAWLPAGMSDPEESDLARYLLPPGTAPSVRAGKGPHLSLTIDEPLMGVGYALAWDTASEKAPRAPSPPALPPVRSDRGLSRVAESLRATRMARNLSLRDAAKRLGVSWVTIHEAEHGRDPRASTLRCYLRAFEELTPQAMLPREDGGDTMSSDELWEFYRDLFGFVEDEVIKTLDIDAAGRCESRIETHGLRAVRRVAGPARLRYGLQRAMLRDQPSLLANILSDSSAMKLRVLERRHNHAVHQFVFPPDVISRGVSYTRTFNRRPIYRMTIARAQREVGGEPPYVEGTSLPILRPVERATLRIQFPREHWPGEFRGHAWADVHVPAGGPGDELDRITSLAGLVRVNPEKRLAELVVNRPPVGSKLAIEWTLR